MHYMAAFVILSTILVTLSLKSPLQHGKKAQNRTVKSLRRAETSLLRGKDKKCGDFVD